MNQQLKKILIASPMLNAIAFILGCSTWYMLYQVIPCYHTFSIPLCFYGDYATELQAPEQVTITVQGYKKDFYSLDYPSLAAHINTQDLHQGENTVVINSEKIFLPPHCKLLHCSPSSVKVTMK